MKRLVLLLSVLLAFLATPAAALSFPPHPQGPIYDEADLLPPDQEAALDQRLRAFDQQTGNAVIVATVNSLQGDDIQDFATKLYAAWGIGGAERDTGVLLLVAPNERKMRIEVGYGLEPYLTDILSGRIIRDEITPRFKNRDMAGGITAGVDAIVTQLSKSPADAKAIAEAAAAAEKNRAHSGGGAAIFFFFMFLFFFVFPIIGALSRKGGKGYRRHGFGSTVGNIALWTALNAAANAGRNSGGGGWGGGGGGGWGGGGGGGFGGFGGGMSGGGGASGGW
jgi:uncharacterized protein